MKGGRSFMNRIMKYVLTLIVLGVFSFLLFWDKDATEESVSFSIQDDLTKQSTVSSSEKVESNHAKVIYIDVKGEVNEPGVYKMTEGERVQDVIKAAGGFTAEASLLSVNLAQKLTDEMVIYVKVKGEEGVDSKSYTSLDSKLYLNQATVEHIQTLPGIGRTKASAIVRYREEHGPFRKVEDLLKVKGIGEKTLNSFKDQIQVP